METILFNANNGPNGSQVAKATAITTMATPAKATQLAITRNVSKAITSAGTIKSKSKVLSGQHVVILCVRDIYL